MPAVMVLIMIPILACVALMLRLATFSVDGVLGATIFSVLAIGVLGGLFRFARELDDAEA